MIDIEMLAAIMKELGYLDEPEQDSTFKDDSDESVSKSIDKTKDQESDK